MSNNSIKLLDENGNSIKNCIDNLDIKFIGDNNQIVIFTPIVVKNKLSIVCGNGSKINIGSHNIIDRMYIEVRVKTDVIIGEKSWFGSLNIQSFDEPELKVNIGNDALFGYGVNFRLADGHCIYDLTTMNPINEAKYGISIGNHVWVGRDVTILKDVTIPDNCVIGMKSLVTNKKFIKNSVIAGIPAKIVKTDINWSSSNPYVYERERERERERESK